MWKQTQYVTNSAMLCINIFSICPPFQLDHCTGKVMGKGFVRKGLNLIYLL